MDLRIPKGESHHKHLRSVFSIRSIKIVGVLRESPVCRCFFTFIFKPRRRQHGLFIGDLRVQRESDSAVSVVSVDINSAPTQTRFTC